MVNLMKNEVGKSSIFREDKKAYIIAEIGLNHNGELQMAKDMITAAAKAGADAVKFQNWKAEDFIVDRSETVTYTSQRKEVTESFFDLCKRNEMKSGWIPILKDYCLDLRTDFISTPTTNEGVDDLINEGIKVIKNGSDYLGHIPLLKYMGQKAEVVIISTGMAFEDEIKRAIQAVQEGGAEVIVLHCTSMYPTPPEDVNLNRMISIARKFNVYTGFSDHTPNEIAAIQAISHGAMLVEKHFTLDHDLVGPDHWFSSTPDEFRVLVKGIRQAETQLGRGDIAPAIGEVQNAKNFKLSSIASNDLKPGDILTKKDITFKKPGTGIPPAFIENYYGKEIVVEVKAGIPIKEEFFR
jgi:N,N'-diacetyllegionaminate synthase